MRGLAKGCLSFAPTFEQAYFIHNFKGSMPAVLYRAYPGPWQLLLRARDGSLELVHEQEAFPGLRGVAVVLGCAKTTAAGSLFHSPAASAGARAAAPLRSHHYDPPDSHTHARASRPPPSPPRPAPRRASSAPP